MTTLDEQHERWLRERPGYREAYEAMRREVAAIDAAVAAVAPLGAPALRALAKAARLAARRLEARE